MAATCKRSKLSPLVVLTVTTMDRRRVPLLVSTDNGKPALLPDLPCKVLTNAVRLPPGSNRPPIENMFLVSTVMLSRPSRRLLVGELSIVLGSLMCNRALWANAAAMIKNSSKTNIMLTSDVRPTLIPLCRPWWNPMSRF